MPITMMKASPTSRPILVSRVMADLVRGPSSVVSCELCGRGPTPGGRGTTDNGRLTTDLVLLCDAEFGRSGPRVGGALGFGGLDGLLRQDLQNPGLLRRPKRLLDRAIFHRLKRDDR